MRLLLALLLAGVSARKAIRQQDRSQGARLLGEPSVGAWRDQASHTRHMEHVHELASQGHSEWLVTLKHPVTDKAVQALRRTVEARGGVLGAHVPHDTWHVHLPTDGGDGDYTVSSVTGTDHSVLATVQQLSRTVSLPVLTLQPLMWQHKLEVASLGHLALHNDRHHVKANDKEAFHAHQFIVNLSPVVRADTSLLTQLRSDLSARTGLSESRLRLHAVSKSNAQLLRVEITDVPDEEESERAEVAQVARALAEHPQIVYVERRRKQKLLNLDAAAVLESGWTDVRPLTDASSNIGGPSVQTPAEASRPFTAAGLTGAGEIVATGDTGIDADLCFFHDSARSVPYDDVTRTERHVDLSHRKVVTYFSFNPGDRGNGAGGHGTHTAGSIAGNVDPTQAPTSLDADLLSRHNGVARDAKLALYDFGTDSALSVPDDIYNDYWKLATQVDDAVRLHSNSWGGSAGYSQMSLDTDRFHRDHPEFLAVMAAGNEGAQLGQFSIASPGNAKNALTVGATRNAQNTFVPSDYVGFELILQPDPVVNSTGNDSVPDGIRENDNAVQVLMSGAAPLLVSVAAETAAFEQATKVTIAEPLDGCSPLTRYGPVTMVRRGGTRPDGQECHFSDKVHQADLVAEANGVVGGVRVLLVADAEGNENKPLLKAMSCDPAARPDTCGSAYTRVAAFFVSASVGNVLQEAWDEELIPRVSLPRSTSTKSNTESDSSVLGSMASFSSRGPTYDLRTKPDVVAPGFMVISARSDGSSTPNQPQCSARSGVMPNAGTSMATPLVAGAAALVRQYLREGFHADGAANATAAWPTAPAALVKALVIASGRGVGGYVTSPVVIDADIGLIGSVIQEVSAQTPSFFSGFGLVNLLHVLPLQSVNYTALAAERGGATHGRPPALFVAAHDSASRMTKSTHTNSSFLAHVKGVGDERIMCIRADEDAERPVRATLVWTDPAPSATAMRTLVNDLDLWAVDGTDGTMWQGNTETRQYDEHNNVEQVVLPVASLRGKYIALHVYAHRVPVTWASLDSSDDGVLLSNGTTEALGQPFALVVSGDFAVEYNTSRCTELPMSEACPAQCSANGICAQGHCSCYHGFYGDDCAEAVHEIAETNAPLSLSLQPFQWRYVELPITPELLEEAFGQKKQHEESVVELHAARVGGQGDPDFYWLWYEPQAGSDGEYLLPTMERNDGSNVECDPCGTTQHSLLNLTLAQMQHRSAQGASLRLGVFGYCCDDSTVRIEWRRVDPDTGLPTWAVVVIFLVALGAAGGLSWIGWRMYKRSSGGHSYHQQQQQHSQHQHQQQQQQQQQRRGSVQLEQQRPAFSAD